MSNETELFSLINNISNDHSKWISRNLQKNNPTGSELIKNICTEELISRHWSYINTGNISLEEYIKGIISIQETEQKLWKSTKEVLWVNSNTDQEHFVPNVYELLTIIFSSTSSKERQKCFQILISCYYQNLKENLKSNGSKLEDILSNSNFEEYVEQFLPCVKLDLLISSLQNEFKSNMAKDLTEELSEFILCPDLLREDCYKIINKLQIYNCEKFTFLLKPLTGLLGNMGHYCNLKLCLDCVSGTKEYKFFTKSPPIGNEYMRNLALLSFEKEEFFYSTFITKLKEYGFGELTNCAPEAFFVRSNSIIVLEDLKQDDYKTIEMRDPSNFEIYSECLKNLAKLHAGSVLFEDYKSKLSGKPYRIDEEYGKYLVESFMFKENDIMSYSKKYVCDYFPSQFPEVIKEINLQEFQAILSEMYEIMYVEIKPSSKFRNVICHGDPWGANIMYKLGLSEDDKTCRLVDFQLIRYAPPLLDVLMFLYIHSNKPFRDMYMKDLILIYQQTLKQILYRFGVDIIDVFNNDNFNECLEELKGTSIILGLLYNHVFSLPFEVNSYSTGDNDRNMSFIYGDRDAVYKVALKDDVFRNRMRGCIEDLYEYVKNK